VSRKIIVNCGPYETRAAILDNDQPYELFYEVPDSEKIVGCIFKGRVANVVPGTQSAFVDIGLPKDAFLTLNGVDHLGGTDDDDFKEVFKSSIQNMLKVGQEAIVQVLKEPTPGKGPRSTMLLSFPGRYLVLTPTIESIGVSRRIGADAERERLRTIGRKLLPKGMGIIFRTAAEGQDERDLAADLKILLKMWSKVEGKIKHAPMRSLIHRDLSLLLKLVRDYFSDDVERFIIDSPDEYKYITEFCDFLTPLQRAALELYKEPAPIFEAFGVEDEIEKALQPKVPLPSGGSLVIERTEAMTTIDINSGRFSGGGGLEDTVFKVNLEAAKEVARQVRLRNLAGVIVIDFIDMEDGKHRNQVTKALKEAFRGDRNRPNVLDMSELGLVQMTRRRTSQSLEELLKSPCPCCSGQGVVFSVSTTANRIRAQVLREAGRFEAPSFLVTAHREVLEFFRKEDGRRVKELEARCGRKIQLKEGESQEFGEFRVEPVLVQDTGK